MKLDENKLKKLSSADELLDKKYGKAGTETRDTFNSEARAWYLGELMRDRRKELNITQQELADRVGTARSYIARVERGQTDIQMSTFFKIAGALGITFSPVFT